MAMLLGKCRNMAFHVYVNTSSLPDKCWAFHVWVTTTSLPDECRDVACHVWVSTDSNTLSQVQTWRATSLHFAAPLPGECWVFHVWVNIIPLPDKCRDVARHVWVSTDSNTSSQRSDVARHVPTFCRPNFFLVNVLARHVWVTTDTLLASTVRRGAPRPYTLPTPFCGVESTFLYFGHFLSNLCYSINTFSYFILQRLGYRSVSDYGYLTRDRGVIFLSHTLIY